ncbi:acyl-CoA dehydrogenase family protein [Cupriavidus basilensis]|uniref:acyl-CoA dehydrogenase family protein n=1 Tax=Cupriavidus basilensis TaxID=68895 RepID=UPI0020A6C0ED|nr:acyl-CoA dehydrogenase family protein [Cupriavidus basilensis]MCP3024225.1 acyl-CoA/acyl-ACP dehydrogenase [Cupriavidus basilensis]
MAIVLNQTQEMLRDSALAFLRESAPIPTLRKLRDTRDDTGFSPALWREFAELGFAGVLIPEQYGGSELGVVEAGVLMEALGRTLAPTPFFSTALLGASLISRGGSAAQKGHFLPAIAAGRHLTALAIDEGAAHRPERQALAAVQQDGGFVLNGAKVFVIDGHIADTLIVVGRTSGNADDRDGVTLFLVPRGADGITVERTVMADARNAARVQFRDVRVAADAVLGEAGCGAAMLEHALDIARVALASELVGIADEAFARTLQYLKERKQFGKIIGEFQALQHRAAHLFSEIEITRAAVLRSQQLLDDGPAQPIALVSAAKARAGSTAMLAVQEAVQMHGGIGMTDEFEIGFYMKRACAAQILLGDTNFHAQRWATLRGY